MAKNTTDLVTNVRRRAQFPNDGGQTFSDADILAMATDELQNVVAPRIYEMRGWHYAVLTQYTLSGSRYYRLPDRAGGGTIISVEIVDTPTNRFVNLIHPLQVRSTGENYYIYANNIVLSAAAPSTGTMIVRYLMAPPTLNQLVGTISSVATLDTMNFVATPTLAVFANLATTGTGFIDFVKTTSPYETLMVGVPVLVNSSTQLVSSAFQFTDGAGSLAAAAPYMTIQGYSLAQLYSDLGSGKATAVDVGQSSYVQLNDEFHDYLAQRTAMRMMEAIGHSEDLKLMGQKLIDLEKSLDRAIAPRARGDFKVINLEDVYYDRRF